MTKYEPRYAFQIYDLAKSGMSDTAIAKAIGIMWNTFRSWKDKYPTVRTALEVGRKNKDTRSVESFKDYVYKHLSEELKPLWNEIMEWDQNLTGREKVEFLLKEKGLRARQNLWVHAFIHSSFNASEACRLIGVDKNTLDHWCNNDPDFSSLLDEMHWHKGNLFEGALVNLVQQGDTSAVLFANRTYNRDRGYNDKQEIEVKGVIDHVHNDFRLEDLPLNIRLQILEWRKSQEESKQIAQPRVKVLSAKVVEDAPQE